MQKSRILLIAISLLLVMGFERPVIADISLVAEGKSQAGIIISERPTQLENHAARELSRYIKEMTGISLPILTERDKSINKLTNAILIGNAETNSLIKISTQKGKLKLSSEFPGLDGFVIKTIRDNKRNYLIIGGSNDRGTLYAVYHFLENICHVGFFWDGARIPSIKTLSIKEANIIEKPYFPERCNMVSSYAWPFWDTADWKHEVDWLVENKFNMSWGLVRPAAAFIAMHDTLADFGIEDNESEKRNFGNYFRVIDDINKYQQYERETGKEVLQYARDTGLETVGDAFGGEIPKQFIKKYPDARVFTSEHNTITDYLHPADPRFIEIGAAFIKKYIKIFGPTRQFYISPYPEVSPGDTLKEKDELQVSFAKGVVRQISAAGPNAKWLCSGWAFTADRVTWDNRALKNFLDVIPNDKFLVWDTWGELQPMYKWTDYFFGKDWAFSVIHCFGGNVEMFGDVKDLIRRVQDIANDPKAKNCKQFFLAPEGIPYNSMYFDLATRLAWNPKEIELEKYLPNFAARRYGEKSVPNMVKCWQELIESVHSTNRYNDALYHRRLGVFPDYNYAVFERSGFVPDFTERFPYIKHLKKALEYALLEKDNQSNNILYQHDIVDISKQYLVELFGYHLLQLNRCYAKDDINGFDFEAVTIHRIMEDLAKITSTRKDYQLQPIVDKALKIPGIGVDTAKRVRDSVSGFDVYDNNWGLWDYNAKDYFESIKFYYQKRVDFYISTLRIRIKSNHKEIDPAKDLDPTYRKITLDFVNNNLQIKPGDRYTGNSAQAAAEILTAWKDISSLDLTPLFGREVKFGPKIAWEDDFSSVRDWKPLSPGGEFTSDGKVVTMKSTKDGFVYGMDLPQPIGINRHPVIGFCAQLIGGDNRLSAVSVVWEDSSGGTRETQLYPTAEMWASGRWDEYRVDLYGLLNLLGEFEKVKPVSIKGIHIQNRPFPCEVKWDWMKITTNN